MTKKTERCVSKVSKNVKPKKGQTKEHAAWGICKANEKKKKSKK